MKSAGDIERAYREFADKECRGYSPLYFDLAVAASEDA